MNLNTYQKVATAFFAALLIFWIVLFATETRDGTYSHLFAFSYGLLPLIGGAVALRGCKVFGGLSNAIGKGVLFLGLGLVCFGLGESVWSYYNIFLGVEAPYPSLADLFFGPSLFFYSVGSIFLMQTTGMGMSLKKTFGKLFAILAPVIILGLSYYVLIVIGRGGVLSSEHGFTLKAILDVAYPLGDFVALTVSVLVSGLSFQYLGGGYKYDIISILAGLAVMFASDSVFSYTTTFGTKFNGDFGDLMYTVGLFLLVFGALGFGNVKNKTVDIGAGVSPRIGVN